MLKVYATNWCPHCRRMVHFLDKHQVEYEYIDIENQPDDVVKLVVDANGGVDWVVPTLEYNGKWRPGKRHNEEEIIKDLEDMGLKL